MENDEDIIVTDIHISEVAIFDGQYLYCAINNIPEPYSSTLEGNMGSIMLHKNADSSVWGTAMNGATSSGMFVGVIYAKFKASARLQDIQSISFETQNLSGPNIDYVPSSDFEISGKLYLLKQQLQPA